MTSKPKLSKPEKRMREKRDQKLQEMEHEEISRRSVQEWPTMKLFNQALRYLEIFAQLMKLTAFIEWMKENIEIRDQIDHKNKTLDTFVIYKGEGKLSEDEPTVNLIPDIGEAAKEGAEPLCAPDPDPAFAAGENQVGKPLSVDDVERLIKEGHGDRVNLRPDGTTELLPVPDRSPDQNIVNCPNCQLTFDANVDVPRISLATEIPKDVKVPGNE